MTVTRVRRPGVTRIFRKSKFRGWLDEQKGAALTYPPVGGPDERKAALERRKNQVGWSTTDFFLESRERGIDLGFDTAQKWATGSEPRDINRQAVEAKFKGIRF